MAAAHAATRRDPRTLNGRADDRVRGMKALASEQAHSMRNNPALLHGTFGPPVLQA